MALPPRQIRYRKQAIYPILAVLLFVLCTMTYTLISSSVASHNWIVFLAYLGALVVIGAVLYSMYQKIKSDQPVITFEHDRLILHRKNKVIFWSSIVEWKIRSHKNNDSLIIRTADGKVRIELILLDHTTKDIKWLMESYIRQPGPSRI